MSEAIKNSIINIFDGNAWLATFVIALLPIFELRGAIPFGMSISIWGENALSPIVAFLTSFLATSLIIPIVALILIPLLKYLKNTKTFQKLASKILGHFEKKSNEVKVKNKNSKLFKILGIMLFVAVPLPLTGVYTGTAIAVLIGLNFYETLIACVSGNLIAGIIITLLSTVLKENSIYVLYAFMALVVVAIAITFIKKVIEKRKSKKNV